MLGLLTPCGSRFKSLYVRLTETEHANLRGLATELYHLDNVKYDLCKPPPNQVEETTTLSSDWHDIHECSLMYGSPELADHLSGHIYMRATVYEDKCSQAYRLADQVAELSPHQLQACLALCAQWPRRTVAESETLQKIIQAIDSQCHGRSVNKAWLHDAGQYQRLAY